MRESRFDPHDPKSREESMVQEDSLAQEEPEEDEFESTVDLDDEPPPAEMEASLRAWCQRTRTRLPMSTEEDIRLAQKMQNARTEYDRKRAREVMIASHMGLVNAVANKYRSSGVPLEDLIQEGTIGLMRAVERFNIGLGYRFSTYAIWWIKQSISRAVSEQARIIRLPAHIQESSRRIRQVSRVLAQRLGRDPNSQELALVLEQSEEKINALLGMTDAISLDAPIGNTKENQRADLIPDLDSPDPMTIANRHLLRAGIEQALESLNPRERKVVILRYGLDGEEPRTLEEVGLALHINRERARQMEAHALKKMRRCGALKDQIGDDRAEEPAEPLSSWTPPASIPPPSRWNSGTYASR